VAFGGSLQDFGMPEILQMIGSENKTGILSIKRKREKISILFERGKVVWLDSSTAKLEEMVLGILKTTGRVSEKEYSVLETDRKRNNHRLSTSVASLQLTSLSDLQRVASFCLLEKFYPVFRWKNGEYNFTQRLLGTSYDKKMLQPIDVNGVVMEGVRQLDEWILIEKMITSVDMVFQKVFSKESLVFLDPKAGENDDIFGDDIFGDDTSFSGLSGGEDSASKVKEEKEPEDVYPENALFLDDTQMAVFSLMDGRYTLDDISKLGEIGAFDVCKTAAKLLCAKVIAKPVKKIKKQKKRHLSGRLLYNALFFGVLSVFLFFLSVSLGNQMAALIIPSENFKEEVSRVQEALALHKKKKLVFAVEVYRLRSGAYPDKLRELVKLGLLDKNDLLAPSEKEYSYKKINNYHFTITQP